jgi:hypothetical protein
MASTAYTALASVNSLRGPVGIAMPSTSDPTLFDLFENAAEEPNS